MQRRHFIKYTGSAVGGLALAESVLAKDKNTKPNILFIMTDQQSAHMMSCAGDPWLKTPALDRLASSGIRFERAYASNPVCVPSRFSLQTGRMPSAIRMGCNSDGQKVPDEMIQQSLGRLFKSNGYETVYGGKVHLPNRMNRLESLGYRCLTKDARQDLAGECVRFIKGKHEKLFLLFASFINPHDICFRAINDALRAESKPPVGNIDSKTCQDVTAKVRRKALEQLTPLPANHAVAEQEPEAITAKYLQAKFKGVRYRLRPREAWQEKDWRIYRDVYRRLMEMVDDKIGQVLNALKDAGLEENTLVVFTSDHGDMDGTHKLQHKSLPYEESARVPFIMSYKGKIKAGMVDDRHLISNGLDLLPTLCDYASIEAPKELHGASIRPLTEEPQTQRWRDHLVVECQHCRMLRTDRFKYAIYDSGRNREQLMDLSNDPGEMINLAGSPDHRDILNRHRKLLKDWIEATGDAIGATYL